MIPCLTCITRAICSHRVAAVCTILYWWIIENLDNDDGSHTRYNFNGDYFFLVQTGPSMNPYGYDGYRKTSPVVSFRTGRYKETTLSDLLESIPYNQLETNSDV
jgi:hypothetical protein